MADKILIVDDDPAIQKMLEKVMNSNNLEADTASDGRRALELIRKNHYQVILLDINMGDIDGFEVIKRIRSEGNVTPIIIISGRNEDYDALYGLSVGADDYITKPFRPVVLGAKVIALIRRSSLQSAQGSVIVRGCFRYDTKTLRFYKNDRLIDLSSKENSMMLLFMQNPERVFTKDMIYEHVWDNTIIVDNNAIMVYINRLRNKIEDNPQKPVYIQTVRGVGYRFSVS